MQLRKRSARLPIQVDQLCTQSAKKRKRTQSTGEINRTLEKSKKKVPKNYTFSKLFLDSWVDFFKFCSKYTAVKELSYSLSQSNSQEVSAPNSIGKNLIEF